MAVWLALKLQETSASSNHVWQQSMYTCFRSPQGSDEMAKCTPEKIQAVLDWQVVEQNAKQDLEKHHCRVTGEVVDHDKIGEKTGVKLSQISEQAVIAIFAHVGFTALEVFQVMTNGSAYAPSSKRCASRTKMIFERTVLKKLPKSNQNGFRALHVHFACFAPT
jgi:hypothetical protein